MLWLLTVALAADWSALRSADGWEEVVDRTIDIGRVQVSRRDIGGMWCLRAEGHSNATPDHLMDVLWDVERAPAWSSNTLLVSDVLVPGADHMVFWQQLDVSMIHDRFWVLDVTAVRDANGTRGFRWDQVDAASQWPAVVAHAQSLDSEAMQPPVMWGEWLFEPTGAVDRPTRVVWRGCQDIGGVIPLWLQAWAGARALPNAVADLVHEAERR